MSVCCPTACPGEYGDLIPAAPYLLEPLIDNYADDTAANVRDGNAPSHVVCVCVCVCVCMFLQTRSIIAWSSGAVVESDDYPPKNPIHIDRHMGSFLFISLH
jgi:hypothetical protein